MLHEAQALQHVELASMAHRHSEAKEKTINCWRLFCSHFPFDPFANCSRLSCCRRFSLSAFNYTAFMHVKRCTSSGFCLFFRNWWRKKTQKKSTVVNKHFFGWRWSVGHGKTKIIKESIIYYLPVKWRKSDAGRKRRQQCADWTSGWCNAHNAVRHCSAFICTMYFILSKPSICVYFRRRPTINPIVHNILSNEINHMW